MKGKKAMKAVRAKRTEALPTEAQLDAMRVAADDALTRLAMQAKVAKVSKNFKEYCLERAGAGFTSAFLLIDLTEFIDDMDSKHRGGARGRPDFEAEFKRMLQKELDFGFGRGRGAKGLASWFQTDRRVFVVRLEASWPKRERAASVEPAQSAQWASRASRRRSTTGNSLTSGTTSPGAHAQA